FIMGYSVVAGATGRLLFGYDSFGNVCGKKNSPVEGAPLSGQDMTLKKATYKEDRRRKGDLDAHVLPFHIVFIMQCQQTVIPG
ncbi:SLC44A3 isoform 3, partial [Pongo abelii]